MDHIFLSRRNLLALLSKLDRTAAGDHSNCSIIKKQAGCPPGFEQTAGEIMVTAMEDKDYYIDREPGEVHPSDIPWEPQQFVPLELEILQDVSEPKLIRNG